MTGLLKNKYIMLTFYWDIRQTRKKELVIL